MNNTLFIPEKINAGFQKRQGTYTGKLAYIIYWDTKGKLRKEGSWQSWRDKKIAPHECLNTPTEGFVLNKKVGGHSNGWNHRSTYCRVYDPRGFEFEINVPNLLFILQEGDCTRGKGLEGKFVYAWQGKDLVLLPASCQEYRNSTDFTSLQSEKVTKKDMVEGCVYTTKKKERVIYLGRREVYKKPNTYREQEVNYSKRYEKMHIFIKEGDSPLKDKSDYYMERPFILEKGFTKLARRETKEQVHDYAELVEGFNKHPVSSKVVGFVVKKVEVFNGLGQFIFKKDESSYKDPNLYVKLSDGGYRRVDVRHGGSGRSFWNHRNHDGYHIRNIEDIKIQDKMFLSRSHNTQGYYYNADWSKVSESTIKSTEFFELKLKLASGEEVSPDTY